MAPALGSALSRPILWEPSVHIGRFVRTGLQCRNVVALLEKRSDEKGADARSLASGKRRPLEEGRVRSVRLHPSRIPETETSMAEIVVLNRWRAEHEWRPQIRIGEGGDSGRLLLFTGVRYERFDDRMDRKAENHAVRAD